MDSATASKPAQPVRRIQILLDPDAEIRIRIAAAKRAAIERRGVSLGDIISELAIAHLAPVDEAQAAR